MFWAIVHIPDICTVCVHKTLDETEGLVALLIFDKDSLSSPTPTALTAAQYTSDGERWFLKSAAHSDWHPFISLLLFPVFNPPKCLEHQHDRDQNTADRKQLLVGIQAEASHLHQWDAVAYHVRMRFIRASSGVQTQITEKVLFMSYKSLGKPRNVDNAIHVSYKPLVNLREALTYASWHELDRTRFKNPVKTKHEKLSVKIQLMFGHWTFGGRYSRIC